MTMKAYYEGALRPPYEGEEYEPTTLADYGAEMSAILDRMTTDSYYDIAAFIATALGTAQGRYAALNNKKGDSAVETAHKVFLDEYYG